MLFNQSVVIMDPRWKHPFPALVAGPTCCGKSQFVKRLVEPGEDMFDGAPENIIWCYGIYQPAYDEIQRNVPNITFMEGVANDLHSMINPSITNLVVIDDLMHELSNDQRITSLFTKGCHHGDRNLSVILILQDTFCCGKELKDMSLNCHYLVLFKSPRDSSQVNHLAKQMFPGHVKYMQEAFQDATKRPYGYLLSNRKHVATSGCAVTSSLGRRNALMSEKYNKSEPQRNESVEHGPATEKEPRLFEAPGKVYTSSM